MKINVAMLEKIGQTQSIQQHDSIESLLDGIQLNDQAFNKLKSQSKDLVCVLFPDDDDE